jgi:hypothetical protein
MSTNICNASVEFLPVWFGVKLERLNFVQIQIYWVCNTKSDIKNIFQPTVTNAVFAAPDFQ